MIPPALRSLRREPGLVAGIVLTLALAIGVTATMLDIVTRLMLSAPPGVSTPDRVARLTLQAEGPDGERFTMSTTSYPMFRAVAERGDAFAMAAAVAPSTMVMGDGESAREIRSIGASGQYFQLLGAAPSLGRLFNSSDDALPAGSTVAVLSYGFWRSHFNGDRGVVGQTMTLAGETYTIIGVATPDFTGDETAPVDVFVPLSAAMRNRGAGWIDAPMNLVSIVARLRNGVSMTQATAIASSVVRAASDERGFIGAQLESLVPSSVRASTPARVAEWLAGVSLLVLLLATANVSTLLVLRSVRKRRDVAVRLALGAGRSRLASQAIVESVTLAAAGALAGLLLSRWLGGVARATLLPNLAASDRLIDSRMFVVAIALALGAGIAAALGPILLVSGYSLTGELYGSGTLGSAVQSQLQRGLVGLQVALCAVLLMGAGLFVRSLERVQGQNLGFSTNNLLYVQLSFRERQPGRERDAAHFNAVRQLSGMPGVTSVSAVQAMPFGNFNVPPISFPGLSDVPTIDGQPPFLYGATPEFLDMMSVRAVQGRLFTAADLAQGAPYVALVNETFAKEVWKGASAIGQCIRAGHNPDPNVEPGMLASSALPCRTVVGVVRDSRARSIRPTGREASLMQYYVPLTQTPPPPAFVHDFTTVSGLLVRVDGDADRMAGAVQRLIQGSAATTVFAKVVAYQDLLDPQMRPWRMGATVFSAFGALAVLITAVGLFGVISYVVTQRTREIGLRLALGGTTAGIGASVVWSALRIVSVGVVVGLAAALASGRYVSDLLFETSPLDPGVIGFAVATFALVTIVAAAWPAWRASRVSPMVALRSD
ncbi:MAG TPA: ABC transporter permease [Gemmatimonadaceae bacterium]